MIAIIDYGAGNLRSVKKALDFLGAPCEITNDAHKIATAAGVILPGVGAFGGVLKTMRARGLFEVTRQAAQRAAAGQGGLFLGICLGQQLLFAASEESPDAEGLDVLPGKVLRFPAARLKVPHMGWNSIALRRHDGLFAGVPEGAYVYFVHSYYVVSAQPEDVAARTEYGVPFDAAVCRNQLVATQFHPEKSGAVGLRMLRNFVELL
ncbi:MAG: imidazole glycerol phosphate synthase subunit HisH [Oscillospiraceae bacterium]|jgi:glutamine amidotransferase|nr:imidazole glycerol phosphate synthase subunit HisH [Oscillospiraceae bacterium]